MSDTFNQFKKQLNSGLQSKRWSLKSITAMILFAAIIAVFALFGFPNNFNNSAGMGAAAQVNDTLISIAEFQNESGRLEQMYAPLFGGNMGDAQRQFVRQQALENLITQEVAAQSAKKQGILATDVELQNMIVRELPYFQSEGRFQRDLYYRILEANRMTPAGFEDKLRKEKITQRTQRLFEAASQPLKFESEKLKALQESKINVGFARVDKDKVVGAMKVGNPQAELVNPEFAKKVQDYYEANKSEFEIAPQVRAQHILIKVDADTTEAQAKAKIEEIKQKAKSGDFAKLAAQYSEDQGSKAKGGDLGTFGKGNMVPEFETAAFSQKIGEVGEPIKSLYGYHLIKVNERKEGGLQPFEKVQLSIAQKLLATEAYEKEITTLEQALAKNDSAAVDAQLKKMGVNWEETGFFDLTADVIPKLQSPEASRVAFGMTQAQGLHPQLIRDGAERYVLRLKGTKKEPVAAGSEAQLAMIRERASDLFRSWIEEAKKSSSIERNPQILSGR